MKIPKLATRCPASTAWSDQLIVAIHLPTEWSKDERTCKICNSLSRMRNIKDVIQPNQTASREEKHQEAS
jgi:hypothetical protein